jgi:hypothetical protein
MSNRTFPIQNSSACVNKWGWNTFRLYTGGSSSCHRVDNVFVPLDNFDNFHNTPAVIEDRKLMLEGKWPEGRGCEYCRYKEESGGISDRLYHNSLTDGTPVDFDPNKNNLYVTPRVLEIYLNNTCNMACLYCIPIFSSKINDELKKFGPLPTQPRNVYIERHVDSDAYLSKMLEWLEENSSKLQRISILGGEPFLQKEHDILLDWFSTHKNPELELSYNTNLNHRPGVMERHIARFKELLKERRINRLDISCSIDCWGPQQEFVRYGLNLNDWQRNFELLLENRWIHVHTASTVSALSIKTLPDLLQRINDYQKQGARIYQTFAGLDGSNRVLYDPVMFGGEFFADDLKISMELAKDSGDRSRLEGIAAEISRSTINQKQLSRMHATLDIIDQRRNTDWKSLYPDIYQFFLENGVSNVV